MAKKSPSSLTPTVVLTALAAALVLILALLLLTGGPIRLTRAQSQPLQGPAELTPAPSVCAVVPNGNPKSLLCLDGYTRQASQASPDKIIASCGSDDLTNGELQLYYLGAIALHRRSGSDQNPDYTRPLEQQLCPLGDGKLSWQHYFLNRALENWRLEAALARAAQEPRPIREEAYKPNETDDLHGKYVAADLPVNNFLYADQPCYKPNSMHQAYLDQLPQMLEELAKQRGYDSLDAYTRAVYGTSGQALLEAAQSLNLGYMLFTEDSYDIIVTEDEVDSYVTAHAGSLPTGDLVELRHVLLVPGGATLESDGSVNATEAQWAECKKEAQDMLSQWQQEFLNSLGKGYNFARLANRESQDLGSRAAGGLYQNVAQGQLVEPLDQWCFDPARKEEDITILRSRLGYHIVFFAGKTSAARVAAREALTAEKQLAPWAERAAAIPLSVNYPEVELWIDPATDAITAVDLLYPDVAHERFPEAMVYFQQDYMYSPYGGSYVGRGGCGITTMAMLATYMTDTILTPDMLARRYPHYHDASGTMGELFRYVPTELGFFLDKTTNDLKEVTEALQNGQPVVSLQHLGHFTSGGHYLLLQRYYPETDTFQVRDSNIYNYGKLPGHRVDYFTREDILSGSAAFYIMQNKINLLPGCSRCTDGSVSAQRLPVEHYICPKCAAALTRSNAFFQLMSQSPNAAPLS